MSQSSVLSKVLGLVSKRPYKLLEPFFKNMSADTIRSVQHWLLKEGFFPAKRMADESVLNTIVFKKKLANPIGVEAEYDTDVEVIDDIISIGYGFGSAGTITDDPDLVPRRYLTYRDQQSMINQSAGYQNYGREESVKRLTVRRGKRNFLGVSIGENSGFIEEDYKSDKQHRNKKEPLAQFGELIRSLAPVCDYLMINISNQNMVENVAYQTEEKLVELLNFARKTINEAAPLNTPPLLLKIAPDMDNLTKEMVAKKAVEHGIDGIVVASGTSFREDAMKYSIRKTRGGLKGKLSFDKTTFLVKEMYYHTQGKIPIIANGGVMTGYDAYRKIRAGATLVGLYSAIIFHGPGIVEKIKKDLAFHLKKDGFKSVNEAVGADLKK